MAGPRWFRYTGAKCWDQVSCRKYSVISNLAELTSNDCSNDEEGEPCDSKLRRGKTPAYHAAVLTQGNDSFADGAASS